MEERDIIRQYIKDLKNDTFTVEQVKEKLPDINKETINNCIVDDCKKGCYIRIERGLYRRVRFYDIEKTKQIREYIKSFESEIFTLKQVYKRFSDSWQVNIRATIMQGCKKGIYKRINRGQYSINLTNEEKIKGYIQSLQENELFSIYKLARHFKEIGALEISKYVKKGCEDGKYVKLEKGKYRRAMNGEVNKCNKIRKCIDDFETEIFTVQQVYKRFPDSWQVNIKELVIRDSKKGIYKRIGFGKYRKLKK